MPHGLLGAPGSPQEAQGTLGAPRAYGPRAPRTPRLSFKFTASEVPNVRVCFSFHHQCRPNDLGWVLVPRKFKLCHAIKVKGPYNDSKSLYQVWNGFMDFLGTQTIKQFGE